MKLQGYSGLTFNSPLSDAHADLLLDQLGEPATVLDLGCGWGELCFRMAARGARATGVDLDERAIERGRRRGGEVDLHVGDMTQWRGGPYDAVICIGASHGFGDTRRMLEGVEPLLAPGGRLLAGEGYWEREPDAAALDGLGATADEFGTLAELVAGWEDAGWSPLYVSPASQPEWDHFESVWCADLEHDGRPEALAEASTHRAGYLGGYRGVLGLAYLVLSRRSGS